VSNLALQTPISANLKSVSGPSAVPADADAACAWVQAPIDLMRPGPAVRQRWSPIAADSYRSTKPDGKWNSKAAR
jgi:hypothetical protein